MDMNGKWKSMNPASAIIFGYQPDEMIGNNIGSLCENESDLHSLLNQYLKQ